MHALNKKQMMFAISISVTAYALAISGCGQKQSPDTSAKAANLVAAQSLAGTWASAPQTVKPGQQNLNFLTISAKTIKLRAACAFDAKDKVAALNTVAEVENDFNVEAKTKNIKIKKAQAVKSTDNADCVVSLATGDIQYSLDADTLIIGMASDGSATEAKANIKDSGMTFKKVTDEQANSLEKELFAKSPAGIAAVAKLDPNAPKNGTVDPEVKKAIDAANKVNLVSLAGGWLLQQNDLKVQNDPELSKKLTKSIIDVIYFNDNFRLNERIACHYQSVSSDPKATPLTLDVPLKLNKIGNDATSNVLDALKDQSNTSGLSYESVLNKPAIKMTQKYGSNPLSPWKQDFIQLTPEQQALATCQVFYGINQEISFVVTPDGKTLTLTDDKNLTRVFNKIDPKNESDSEKAALAALSKVAGDSKIKAKADDSDDLDLQAALAADAAQSATTAATNVAPVPAAAPSKTDTTSQDRVSTEAAAAAKSVIEAAQAALKTVDTSSPGAAPAQVP